MVENPFILYGYHSPPYFCDRVQETRDLIEAFENGRNVTLLAPRRMGKTGLIQNAFYELRKRGDWNTAYVDVFAAQNLSDFAHRLGSAIIGTMDTNVEKALKTATRFFRSFRPVVSIDPTTGSQAYSFTLDPRNVETTLKECFDYLAKSDKPCVVAIDEFQQVAEFPEKGAEALLRSFIQFLPKTRFVFAGSKRHLMAEMFSAPKRPFYNSTQMFPLGVIGREAYYAFAAKHMKDAGISLSVGAFDRVYDLFGGVTWYVQAVMNRLYAFRSAEAADIARAIDRLVAENAYNFGNLLETLPRASVRLLKAVAAKEKVRKASLGKLMDEGLVSRNDDGDYLVDDRLFGIWLSRQAN